jgi:CRISPR-associated endonuclease/helicase Cas3
VNKLLFFLKQIAAREAIVEQVPQTLLAKSKREGRVVSLEQHLLDTEQAAVLIFRLGGRWGRNWCRFFGLHARETQEKFLLNLRIAALFHDIGKANADFYRAVTHPAFVPQSLRHEHISALLLHLPAVRSWLARNPALDLEVITAAVLSHHIKAALDGDWKWCQPRGTRVLRLFLQHEEVRAIFERIKLMANLTDIPTLPTAPWTDKSPWLEAWQHGDSLAKIFNRQVRHNKERRALLLAVKAGVIVADAASSGLVREGHSIEKWIEEVVHDTPIGSNDIGDAIINPRIRQISETRPFTFRPFQENIVTQGPRVLLLAACAAGKTLAAWKWAEAQARKYEIGKVIFLYPTRGTATEGFRDYVGWAPETEGVLVHGTARYELEAMLANPSEATEGKSHKLTEADERLFALGLWSRRYFSATVDQFLSFMEHGYTSLCLLPVLADSAVIIDEVHSFDQRMFKNLVAFLQSFDVPVLCMTATLPPSRRKALAEAGLRLYPNLEEPDVLASLEEQEKHPRYHHQPMSDANNALQQAIAAYRKGERVLWVVNTVKRCQRLAIVLEQKLENVIGVKVKVLSYHSRFRLCDRQRIHSETVTAFQQDDAATIAVTTQVCEMSLDLDADVLITEVAPVPSLVQRFGRANRHLAKGSDFRARLYTYKPESSSPYTQEEIHVAAAFLADMGTGDVSQRRMAELLEAHSIREPQADGSARFLDGGYFATPGVFRDADDFTNPCILDCDLETVKGLLEARKPYDGYVVGVPHKMIEDRTSYPSWLPKFLGIARSEFYDKERGFIAE